MSDKLYFRAAQKINKLYSKNNTFRVNKIHKKHCILNLAIIVIAMARAKKIQHSTKSSSRNSDANGNNDSNNNND